MIVLINPPAKATNPVLPLGIACLAAYLIKNDIEVKIIDAWAEGLDIDKTCERIMEICPPFTGISVMSPRYNDSKEIVSKLRKKGYTGKIILGGPHPSALPEETLADIAGADISVIGEGEETLLEIMKMGVDPLGMAYRNGKGEIKRTQLREPIGDINILPMPARELFPLEKYKTHPPYGRKNPYMNMITSRGCPFSCNYCSKSVFGRTYRALSPEKVADEIEHLIDKYSIKEIHFYDDDFTIDVKRAEAICDEIIKRGIKLLWSCTTRVDLVSRELLKKMKKAGCWMIAYGVESGCQKILDNINKNITLEQIKKAFLWTKETGIKTLGYFMVGSPGETKKDIEKTIRFSKELKADFASWSILYAFPGTPFYDLLKKSKSLYYLKENERVVTPYGSGDFYIFQDNLSAGQLWQLARKANMEFYFRPSYILDSILNIRGFQDISLYFDGTRTLIKTLLGRG